MAQAKRKSDNPPAVVAHMHRALREGLFLTVVFTALYLMVALVDFSPRDPGWANTGLPGQAIENAGGRVGAWLASAMLFLFGYPAYAFPLLLALLAWRVLHRQPGEDLPWGSGVAVRGAGLALVMPASCGLAGSYFHAGAGVPADAGGAGGAIGGLLVSGLVAPFDHLGATLVLILGLLVGVTLLTGISWLAVFDRVGGWVLLGWRRLGEAWQRWREGRMQEALAARPAPARRREVLIDAAVEVPEAPAPRRKAARIEPAILQLPDGERSVKERQVMLFDPPPDSELPPLDLLDPPRPSEGGYSNEDLQAMARLVEVKLKDFGVQVEVVAVQPGPVITRFELQPAPGVKVAQISNLAKDLARALSTVAVRVVEVIPGKTVVGLEIPNEKRDIVSLSEIVRSKAYESSGSPLTLALGKDIAGQPVVADLARMPHLLVAGTTGSGKSVAVNAMILSLLYKTLPRDVRLIMVDPKMLELSIYEGIPHLLTDVVTDMKEAADALRWCVGEMERRYKLMSAVGVRNLAGYNKKVRDAIAQGEPVPDPLWQPETVPFAVDGSEIPAERPTLEPLPYIVVIIDELADLMMVVGKKVEELIARLAQKARASGIHLILATQRPSVDVITGLIKANIPTRIAFQVSSRIDSRTILDQQGAEHLLGHGDMLYLPPGTGLPVRVHGAFVSDQEVHRIVAHLAQGPAPEYIDLSEAASEPVPGLDGGGPGEASDAESDPLYDQAVKIVTETRRASASGVQRRLKIGYNRASRLIEAMEAAGVVGPMQSNGNREVLAPPPVGE